jgi:hypothetical protein
MFAESAEGELVSLSNEFHCWVEAEGWLIDFMAPVFPQLMTEIGHTKRCERKMMQKRFPLTASSTRSLQAVGDFICVPDLKHTNEILSEFQSKPANADLAQISVN